MSDQTRASMELNCPGCGAFFRLKPQKGKSPKGPIPCPKCKTPIPVESSDAKNVPQKDALPQAKDAPPKAKVMGLGIIKRRKTLPKSDQQPSTAIKPAAIKPAALKPKEEQPPAQEFGQDSRDKTAKSEQLSDTDSEWDVLDISSTGAINQKPANSTYLGLPVQRFQAESKRAAMTKERQSSRQLEPDSEELKDTANQGVKTLDIVFSREQTVSDNQAILEKLRQVRSTRDLPPVKVEDLEQSSSHKGVNHLRVTAEHDQSTHARQTPMSMDKLDKLFEDEDGETQARVKPQDVSWLDTDNPFDLKDILDAEQMLGNTISGDITRNPALDGSMHIRPSPPSIPKLDETFGSKAKRPRSGQVSHLTLDLLERSVASDNDRSSSGAFQHARVSTGDIFSEISLSMQDVPAPSIPEVDSSELLSSVSEVDESTEGMKASTTPVPETNAPAVPKPKLGNLAARLKKKVGSSGLDKLRDQLGQEPQQEHARLVLPPDHSVETIEIANIDDLVAAAIEESSAASEQPQPSPMSDAPLPTPNIISAKSTFSGRPNSATLFKTVVEEAHSPATAQDSSKISELIPPDLFPEESGLDDLIDAPSTQDEIHDGDLSGIPLISGFPQASQSADDLKIIRSKSRRADDSHSGLIKPLAQTLNEESSVILGAAGERRGSGYIRLPTTEILDVLGKGRYRLMVEDIVYEPVDEQALTQLIKQGVLMGAAMIADEHSDWKPVAEHPVFKRLRKRMAIEAHALLAKYKREEHQAHAPEVPAQPTGVDEQSADEQSVVHSAATRENIPAHVDEYVSEQTVDEQEVVEDSVEEFVEDVEDVEESEAEVLEQLIGTPEGATPQATSPEASLEDSSKPKALDTIPVAPVEDEPAKVVVAVGLPHSTLNTNDRLGLSEDEDITYTPRASWKLPVALVLIAGIVVAGFFLVDHFKSPAPVQPKPPAPEIKVTKKTPPDVANKPPTQVTPKQPKEEVSAKQAKALVDQGDHTQALDMLGVLTRAEPKNLELRALTVEALLAAGKDKDARATVVGTLGQTLDDAQRSSWQALYVRSIKEDEALNAHAPKDLGAEFAKSIVARPQQSVHQSWELETKQGAYIFTTSRPESKGHWGSEVASWRLCQMMLCPFEIPETIPARVLKSDLIAWIRASDFPNKDAAIGRLTRANVDLREEQDAQQKNNMYVYGALQSHSKQVAPFPIEFKALWAAMVNVREDAKMLERPISAVLASLDKFESGRFAKAINAQTAQLDTKSLVSQLSTILLFDYLINHRPRFQRKRDNYGSSTGLHQGRLYTVGHEDSWGLRASNTIRGRFRYVSRFSSSSITALTLLEPSFADAILFPNPTATQEKRLKVFWSQRARALKRVQTVQEGYTPARVMSLP